MNLPLSAYLGIALAAAVLLGGAGWKHAISVQEQFDAFKLTQESLARIQQQENAKEKTKHETDIKLAVSDRDLALAKLRERQRAGAGGMSVTPKPTEGTDKLCFERAKLDGAIQSLIGDFQAIAGEGDAALIDNRAWAEAWPR